MRKIILLIICFSFYGCKEQSRIPISNTLELALGKNYNDYVRILNEAYEKDNNAMLKMLKINCIYDSAGYDHGHILYQLIIRYNDKEFSNVLHKLSKKDLSNVVQYLEVGLDANDMERLQFKRNYPICSNILQIR